MPAWQSPTVDVIRLMVVPLLATMGWFPVMDAAAGGAVSRTVKQGEVFTLTFDGHAEDVHELRGRFDKQLQIPVFATERGAAVLVGVDMESAPGVHEFVLERRRADAVSAVERIPVTVVAGDFGTQELRLRQDQVDLDPATVRRVEEEQRAMLAAMQPVTPRRWDLEFVLPSDGRIQRTFGLKRIINGQPRKPHTGEDISAPEGAPVRAINHGVVQLVAEQFFSGKSIVIDHGAGLFSMYFHLSSSAVRAGDPVRKGQVIGAVGASGRVSGPHLHWGVRLNGTRINPLSLAVLSSADFPNIP